MATAFSTNLLGHPTSLTPIAFNSNSNISYFVGVDASLERPNMLLAGDRSLTNGPPSSFGLEQSWAGSLGTNHTSNRGAGWDSRLHGNRGNLCFADGSVQQTKRAQLRASLRASGDQENRIAKPD